jgi:hypothetical protein
MASYTHQVVKKGGLFSYFVVPHLLSEKTETFQKHNTPVGQASRAEEFFY